MRTNLSMKNIQVYGRCNILISTMPYEGVVHLKVSRVQPHEPDGTKLTQKTNKIH